ncbi:hypothetical protein [Pseudomonas sp.]|uniref:hypothetical protein n=1 Tax=Pseudomonas sp. TaxID=306 RepID=UPI003FD87444
MINLKITTLIMYLVVAAGVSAGGTMFLIHMNNTASVDAMAVMNSKSQPVRPAETFRHIDPVNTGRTKEY